LARAKEFSMNDDSISGGDGGEQSIGPPAERIAPTAEIVDQKEGDPTSKALAAAHVEIHLHQHGAPPESPQAVDAAQAANPPTDGFPDSETLKSYLASRLPEEKRELYDADDVAAALLHFQIPTERADAFRQYLKDGGLAIKRPRPKAKQVWPAAINGGSNPIDVAPPSPEGETEVASPDESSSAPADPALVTPPLVIAPPLPTTPAVTTGGLERESDSADASSSVTSPSVTKESSTMDGQEPTRDDQADRKDQPESPRFEAEERKDETRKRRKWPIVLLLLVLGVGGYWLYSISGGKTPDDGGTAQADKPKENVPAETSPPKGTVTTPAAVVPPQWSKEDQEWINLRQASMDSHMKRPDVAPVLRPATAADKLSLDTAKALAGSVQYPYNGDWALLARDQFPAYLAWVLVNYPEQASNIGTLDRTKVTEWLRFRDFVAMYSFGARLKPDPFDGTRTETVAGVLEKHGIKGPWTNPTFEPSSPMTLEHWQYAEHDFRAVIDELAHQYLARK